MLDINGKATRFQRITCLLLAAGGLIAFVDKVVSILMGTTPAPTLLGALSMSSLVLAMFGFGLAGITGKLPKFITGRDSSET